MVILITGITSGFGRAMAARLSADGHKVYGTHRKATDLLPGVTYIQADAQRAEDCEAAVKQVLDAEGRIDVFINNAGMGIGGPLEFSSLEDAQRQMDVNSSGPPMPIPALLMNTSMRPSASSTCRTAASQSASFWASALM